jgi:predicted ATPase/class 3 adenylate cyclase
MLNSCPQCGSENPVGTRVCMQCASSLVRTCPNCGFDNPTNFRFCGNCGNHLLGTPATPFDETQMERVYSAIPPGLAEKISRAGKQLEGERRQVTVLFADLSGFTAASEKLDPEQVYEFVDSLLKAFIDEIYRHEGTLDKFMGDGVMALFGAPVAHEDDPARALRAALGMQIALRRLSDELESRLGVSLKMRVGLNTGTVVVGSVGSNLRMNYTALGDTVNVAARLQTLAEPGTILVSRPIYEATRPLFEFRELGSIRVKGRVEPVEIFEVIAPRHSPGRVRGIPGLAAPMVGRSEEFARLRQAVEKLVSQRQGRIVLVTGEAGIGKSRLTAEFEQFLSDKPVTVLEGACLPYGQPAYGVFLRLLRAYFQIADDDGEETLREKIERSVRRVLEPDTIPQVLPYLEKLFSVRVAEKGPAQRVEYLEPAQLQQQTFVAVRALLMAQARKHPLVLIFEDIHWVDRLSLDLLISLLGTVEHLPLLLHCTSRPGEGSALPQIQKLGTENFPSSFVHLNLSPLSQADSIALMDLLLTIADLPEYLKQTIPQRAEGNPFYLEEIIRMLIDRGIIRRANTHWEVSPDADLAALEVPQTLQGLIMTRVDHLSESARQMIQCASVIGRDFSCRLLGNVMEGAPSLQEDLQELEDHELIRRVGGGNDDDYHFHHVLIQETVYNSLLLRRRERLHHKIAEGIEMLFADRLEDHTEPLAYHYTESKDASHALPYLIRAGARAAARFANDEALSHYRLAADSLTQTHPTVDQRIEVYSGLGAVRTFTGDYGGALDAYLAALDLIRTQQGAQAPRFVAEMMRRIGRVQERRGDYVQALHWLENALTELDRDPSSIEAVERVRIYNDIGWVHHRRGELEDAYRWRMKSLQIAEGTDYYNELASVYNGLAAMFRNKGDWARAMAYAEKGLRLRETLGDTYGVANSHTNLGVLAWDQGDWNKALHHLERSLELKRSIGDIEGVSRLNNNLSEVCLVKGDYERAIDLAKHALAIAEKIKNSHLVCLSLVRLGQVEILENQTDRAIVDLKRSLNVATEMGSNENQADAQWLLAEAFLRQQRVDQAEECARLALAVASQMGKRLIEGSALRTLGEIACIRKEPATAAESLERSVVVFSELKNPFELAKTQFQLARLQRASNQPAQARATLEMAIGTFRRLGAEAELQHALAELESLKTV